MQMYEIFNNKQPVNVDIQQQKKSNEILSSMKIEQNMDYIPHKIYWIKSKPD